MARRRKNGAREIETRLSALQDDFETLQSNVVGLANGVGHQVVQTTGRAAGRVENWADGNVGLLRRRVRNQPLASCMVSVGFGALVGALLSSRR